MDLDPVVLLPALLFTVLAVFVASSLLRSSGGSSGTKKPKPGSRDGVPPSKALGEAVRTEPAARDHPELQAIPEPAPEPIKVSEPAPEPATEPVKKSESNQEIDRKVEPEPVLVSKPAQDQVAGPEPDPIPVEEPKSLPHVVATEESAFRNEVTPKLVPESLRALEPVPEPAPEPVNVPQTLPEKAVVQELGPDGVKGTKPEPAAEPKPFPEPKSISVPDTTPELGPEAPTEPDAAVNPDSEPKPVPEPVIQSDDGTDQLEHAPENTKEPEESAPDPVLEVPETGDGGSQEPQQDPKMVLNDAVGDEEVSSGTSSFGTTKEEVLEEQS